MRVLSVVRNDVANYFGLIYSLLDLFFIVIAAHNPDAIIIDQRRLFNLRSD